MAKTQQRVWRELFQWQETVFCVCLGFCRNADDAKDLTQEVFIKAYTQLPPLSSNEELKAWLLRVARNLCIDQYRKRRIRDMFQSWLRPQLSDANTPPAIAEQKDQIAMLKRGLQRLDQRFYEVLVLREYGELSYAEIARVLRIRIGTVMSRLNRGRQALARFLAESQGGSHG